MVDNVFAVFLLFIAAFNAWVLCEAVAGEKWAVITIAFMIAMKYSDYLWANRDAAPLYGFLKGLLG